MGETHDPSRRTMIGMLAAVGGLALSARAFGEAGKPADTGNPADTSAAVTTLHQDVEFKASRERLYAILLDARTFAAFTGQSAEIDPKVGGAFTLFGGQIVGHIVELVPGRRIVQAWRRAHWDAGVYSTVTFEFQPHGIVTTVVLDQTGFPSGDFESLNSGWEEHYWGPLHSYLA